MMRGGLRKKVEEEEEEAEAEADEVADEPAEAEAEAEAAAEEGCCARLMVANSTVAMAFWGRRTRSAHLA
jgi:hypothetical protein